MIATAATATMWAGYLKVKCRMSGAGCRWAGSWAGAVTGGCHSLINDAIMDLKPGGTLVRGACCAGRALCGVLLGTCCWAGVAW